MSNQIIDLNANDEAAQAAREASQKAAEKAKEFALNATTAIKGLDLPRLLYLVVLVGALVATLVFDMTSYSVGSSGPSFGNAGSRRTIC